MWSSRTYNPLESFTPRWLRPINAVWSRLSYCLRHSSDWVGWASGLTERNELPLHSYIYSFTLLLPQESTPKRNFDGSSCCAVSSYSFLSRSTVSTDIICISFENFDAWVKAELQRERAFPSSTPEPTVSFPPAARVRENSRAANEYAQRERDTYWQGGIEGLGGRVTQSCRPAATS